MAFETRALTGKLLAQRYRVGELSRETDVATQFRGVDTRTGGAVDIDVVREGLGADSNAARALELEAMTACEIRHPNVVTPRDVGVLEDRSPFVITTHVDGTTLDDRISGAGGMPVGDVVRIGLDLLSALAAAHDIGVMHGDLQPESILLVQRDGIILQTLISGFGRRSSHVASPFVAPELQGGGAATVASDLFACAAILYLASTDLPARLVRMLVEALHTDPSKRYASARDMLHALEIAHGAFAFGSAYTKARPARDPYATPSLSTLTGPATRYGA